MQSIVSFREGLVAEPVKLACTGAVSYVGQEALAAGY